MRKGHKSKLGFRESKTSPEFMWQRKKSLENIISKECTKLRVSRSIQVVFRILKQDFGFKRFLIRGACNIETQFFLLAFAFNVEKLCTKQKIRSFWSRFIPFKNWRIFNRINITKSEELSPYHLPYCF